MEINKRTNQSFRRHLSALLNFPPLFIAFLKYPVDGLSISDLSWITPCYLCDSTTSRYLDMCWTLTKSFSFCIIFLCAAIASLLFFPSFSIFCIWVINICLGFSMSWHGDRPEFRVYYLLAGFLLHNLFVFCHYCITFLWSMTRSSTTSKHSFPSS